ASLLYNALGPPVVERPREGRVCSVSQAVGEVVRVGHAASLEKGPVLKLQVVAAGGDLVLGRGAGERVEESWDRIDRDRPRSDTGPAVAQHLDDGLRPAHAVAAARHHAERQ